MKISGLLTVILLPIIAGCAFAGEEGLLRSPSGLITVEDSAYAKFYNIPVFKQNTAENTLPEKDEFLKRQEDFLESTQVQRMYMDEFYFMRAPYKNFYRLDL